MAGPRTRRIVRWAAISAVSTVLLVVSYLSAYGAYNWYSGQQLRQGDVPSVQIRRAMRYVFTPIYAYLNTDYPCARVIQTWGFWCMCKGTKTGETWEQCWRQMEQMHELETKVGRENSN